MFQNILVPTDFSEQSKHALDIAVNIVRHEGGTIRLLHVIETIAGTTFEEFEGFYTKLEKRARNLMDTFMVPYEDSHVKIELKILYGNRPEQILKFALEHNIDLIVMNSHKIRPEDPVQGWGTISYKVAVLSQCPVMLVK
jgi:nucleotide-binding universal stress UspA family protein